MSLAIWYNWKKSRRERTGGFFLEKRIFKILYEADIMKDKRSNRYKTAAWILLIAGIVSFSVINIFFAVFSLFQPYT